MDGNDSQSMMDPPMSLHSHRLDNNSSKLPSFRSADLSAKSLLNSANQDNARPKLVKQQHWLSQQNATTPSTVPDIPIENNEKREHVRTQSVSVASTPSRPSLQPRPLTSPGGLAIQPNIPSQVPSIARQKARNLPASHSGNNGYLGKGPPPAMITQKIYLQATETENSTKDWVVNQSAITATSPDDERKPLLSEPQEPEPKPVTPLIPPIRGFKTSRKSSVEINATSPRVTSMDQDETIRPLDGYSTQRLSRREQEEQSSDDSDLFLKLAREETLENGRGPIRRVCSRIPMHCFFCTSGAITPIASRSNAIANFCLTVPGKSPIPPT